MTLIDVNLLLYAYDLHSPQHARAVRWLKDLLECGEPIALPWVTVWAFIRISTNSRIWPNPRSASEAFAVIREWLAHPAVVSLQPGPRHLEILESLVTRNSATGPLASDAVLAALAIENGALLASSDQDFSRFSGLRWVNPLSLS